MQAWDQRYKRALPDNRKTGIYYPKHMATTWTRKFRRTPMSAHLDDHAVEIDKRFEWMERTDSELDYYRINTGLMLLDAQVLVRQRLGQGKWIGWCRKHLRRSQRDIARLIALAKAEYPAEVQQAENAARRLRHAKQKLVANSATQVTAPSPVVTDDDSKVVPFRSPMAVANDDHAIEVAVTEMTAILDGLSDNQCHKVMQRLEAYLRNRSAQYAS